MRHTRNLQIVKASKLTHWGDAKNYPIQTMRKKMIRQLIDQTFKWHSEAVSSNFWSNWRKSCVSFDYKSSHPNAVGMATKYLPTKERN